MRCDVQNESSQLELYFYTSPLPPLLNAMNVALEDSPIVQDPSDHSLHRILLVVDESLFLSPGIVAGDQSVYVRNRDSFPNQFLDSSGDEEVVVRRVDLRRRHVRHYVDSGA